MNERLSFPPSWQTLAWRHFEEARGEPMRDRVIEAAAMTAAADLPTRIALRARAFCAREGIDAALARYARHSRQALTVAALLGLVTGLGAARLVPEAASARANAMDLLGALLLPNVLALLLWIGLQLASAFAGRGAAGSLLGRGLQRALEHLTAGVRAERDAGVRAARRAWLEYHATLPAGRARLALLSHTFWLALALGALLGCWWLLSLRQVDFYWGSTLLGADTVSAVIDALARPIAWLGLPVPDAADIAASRLDAVAADPSLRARWGWFLLGALAVYGVLPRALALACCVSLAHLAERRFAPDLAQPGLFRLRAFLFPDASATRVLDPDDAPATRASARVDEQAEAPPASAAWLALERPLAVPAGATDLGTIVDRDDQQRVLAVLAANPAWPALVVHAPLAATPDRGVAQFVASLVTAAQRPLWLHIAATKEATLSAADRADRIDDWRAVAVAAGIPASRVACVPA